MSYTNIFGGYTINTAFPSYANYLLQDGQILQLNWASSFVDSLPGVNNVTAQINDISSVSDDNQILLGDATLISVGQTVQFNNLGANLVNIFDFQGNLIDVLSPINDNQIILYLQDNTTKGGIWGITHLGAGTSFSDASILAGPGTIALPTGPGAQINTNFLGKTIDAAYQVVVTDRAQIIVWTGGTANITLVPIASLPVGGGFYIAVNNEGTGVVTLVTSDGSTIDGNASFSLDPGQSSYFINVVGTGGSNWNTLGFGTPTFFQVQTLSLNLTPFSGTFVNLTPAQAKPLIQTYTGALTGNVSVFYPAAAGQWYIFNSTSNAFTVTVQLGTNASPVGSPIVIPQGTRVIIYSDGTTLYSTPTIITNATFADGSVGAPGISFLSDPTTGFYKIPPNPVGVVGYSSAGTQSLLFGGATSGYGLALRSGETCRFWNSANSAFAEFKASNSTAVSYIMTLPPSRPTGSGNMLFGNNALNLFFSDADYPNATVANQILYSSITNTITGLATANNGVLVTSNAGVPSIKSTLPLAVQSNITQVGVIISGVWNGTDITVSNGGTGLASFTPYSVICGGVTGTANLQQVATLGTSGQVLTSNGAGTRPTWQTISSSLAATIAEMKAASSTTVYTSPGRQQYHPSAAGFWVDFNGLTGTRFGFYNVSSVTRTAAGTYTINLVNGFVNNHYAVLITVRNPGGADGNSVSTVVTGQFTSSVNIVTFRGGVSPTDFPDVYVIGFGLLV